MDAHQAYCVNFLALAGRWGSGRVAVAAAWALSVLAITLTVAAAWLLGEQLAAGTGPVDLEEVSRIEFWVAFIVGIVNYSRFFSFFLLGKETEGQRAELLQRRTADRVRFAVVALLAPAVVVFVIVVRNLS